MEKKKLPLGTDSFREIREEGQYYVDKTPFAAQLIDGAKHNFLSRPRRFGKSLFVDTLQSLFEGEKKLFEGLDIYDKWDWTVKYPVLRLSFGGADFTEPGQLNTVIMERLAAIERREKLTTEYQTAPGRFADLIERLCERDKRRVVVLIDEYDKPIFDALETPGMEDVARANRRALRAFYGNIKECEAYIQFSFLTGVSKFAQAGIFSGLNNLTDITLDPEFSSICGYTDHDIDTVFAPRIGEFDREEIKEWYNGYTWSSDEKVYNPFSILKLFTERKFEDWWFRTATPTFLIEVLKQRGGIGALDLTRVYTGSDLLSAIDVGNIEVPVLLFQTGYLTITDVDDSGGKESYRLDFPNREVRESLNQYLLRAIAPETDVALHTKLLRNALVSGDFDSVEAQLRAMFSNIAHPAYNPSDIAKYEGHYASNAHTCLSGTGLVVRPEDPTNHGNIDLTVEAGTRIYVFEFKVLKSGVTRGAAMRQLRDMNYADKYRARGIPVHLVGVEFDVEDRNIKHFDTETI